MDDNEQMLGKTISESLPEKSHIEWEFWDDEVVEVPAVKVEEEQHLDDGKDRDYPVDEAVMIPAINIVQGQYLDVKAWLSSEDRDYVVSPMDGTGVPISSLDNKYIIVYGFSAPFIDDERSYIANNCLAIQALYTELSLRGIADDVKLVVILRPDPAFTVTEADLCPFFSRMPVNCLTVPISDSRFIHDLCVSLGYDPEIPSFRQMPQLVVNPSGIVVQRYSAFLTQYGALSFPFTLEHFKSIDLEDRVMEHELYFSYEPITVQRLFRCEKLSEIADEMKFKSTDELDNALVGIYLYFDGNFMDKLQDIHKKCVDKGLRFEIVLVPFPFHSESDPASFYNQMKRDALKYTTSSSWLAFPYDEKICRKLWRMYRFDAEDQLIILQHDDCPGEWYGKKIVSNYGIDAYPFNRSVVAEDKVSELRSFTVDSLFEDSEVEFSHPENLILQIDYTTQDMHTDFHYRPFLGNLTEIRVKYPDIQDFYIPLKKSKTSREPVPAVSVGEYVIELLFMKGTYVEEPVRPLVVVFGKDGKIISRHNSGELCPRTAANLFCDTLRYDILYELRNEIKYTSW